MKILKIFGVVVGIHVFALILVFANPGCSSTTKPPPAPSDTISAASVSPSITIPDTGSMSPVPVGFDPNAPAMPESSGGVRFTPTRPGTPVAGALITEPVTDVTPATTYTVQGGDSLWSLHRRFNVPMAQIAAANNIKTTAILRPGQKLVIPGKTAAPAADLAAPDTAAAIRRSAESTLPPPPPVAKTGSDTVKHVVRIGETLSEIARNYGVKQGDIAVANNISDPQKIKAGTELIIPGWRTPGSKSGKAASNTAATQKARESEPVIHVEEAPPPTPPSDVPVIRVDESPMGPITPAPKN